MNTFDRPQPGPQLPALIATSLGMIEDCGGSTDGPWLLVDSAAQALWLVRAGRPERGWTVSTSSRGLDNRDGSGGTPPGVHRVAR
ncbi:hypothetical protein CSB20_03650, partial [bacterium DOLZORAL124_64_63]